MHNQHCLKGKNVRRKKYVIEILKTTYNHLVLLKKNKYFRTTILTESIFLKLNYIYFG